MKALGKDTCGVGCGFCQHPSDSTDAGGGLVKTLTVSQDERQ